MIGWLDCAAGASGDMLLGALVDVGVPLAVLQDAVDGLGVEPITLHAEPVLRHGLGATHVRVEAPPGPPSRDWTDIRALLAAARLDDEVRAAAQDVFARLARAEGSVHRVPAESVHFHEVGALDALADVVGVCAGVHHLGLDALVASPVTLGSGTVRGEHGLVPVPGPAVLALLTEAGAPVVAGPAPYEMCTPTGAALLAGLCTGWGGLPPSTPVGAGSGAGSRDVAEVPNLLRLVLARPAAVTSPPTAGTGPTADTEPTAGTEPPTVAAGGEAYAVRAASHGGDGAIVETAVVLEANVDDLDPRVWPSALAALLAAGASDAWISPIVMKKGRPAHTVHVLSRPAALDAVRTALVAHTSTIGLRETRVEKYALAREEATVDVDGHRVRVKRAVRDGATVNASVEFEDVAAAADALGVPVKVALGRATAAAHAAGLLP